MIVKSFVLRRESFNEIVGQCVPGTIDVVRPEKALENMIRTIVDKMVTRKQNVREEIAAVSAYLDGVSSDAAYRQKKDEFLQYVEDYLRSAAGYSVSMDLVEDYVLAQCAFLCAQAVADAAGLEVMDGRELVVCHQEGVFDWTATGKRIVQKCRDRSGLVVSGGYARTILGMVLRIGKGGANMMASLLGSALGAELIEFYVEGDGINGISAMTYDEAAHYCARSAAPFPSAALWPAKKAGIPIVVRSISKPGLPGTGITASGAAPDGSNVSGIIADKNLDLVTVYGTGLLGQVGASSSIFSSLAKAGINIRFISQTSSEYAISFAVDAKDRDKVISVIDSLITENPLMPMDDVVMLNREVGIVTVYGSRMKNIPGVSGKVFSTLGEAGVNVIAAAQGGEELSISVVLDVNDVDKAAKALAKL
ncbi:MAG: ACT domain-containing protein [Bacteroidales bacterium]|nr:ACT domain-containing protein [Bacteroidales bacterium]